MGFLVAGRNGTAMQHCMAPPSDYCDTPFTLPSPCRWHRIMRCNVRLLSFLSSECSSIFDFAKFTPVPKKPSAKSVCNRHHLSSRILTLCGLIELSSIQSADVDCAMYLVAASGLFVTMKSFLGDLQIVSPSVKAWISLVLVTGTVTFVFWLVLTKKVSLASLFISFFALCVFIYGALEVAFAVLGRWAVRSDMFSDVVRYVLLASEGIAQRSTICLSSGLKCYLLSHFYKVMKLCYFCAQGISSLCRPLHFCSSPAFVGRDN